MKTGGQGGRPLRVPAWIYLPIELGIKRNRGRLEVHLLHERRRLRGPVFAVHPAVLPLDGERPLVADVVERDDDLFEVDVAVAEAAEVPVPPRVREGHVPAEHADVAVAVAPPDVLHVDVV